MMEQGSEEVVENVDVLGLLIELVQQYEFLYDLGHRDYKNSKKKEQAWAEIAEIANISVDDCMRLWKNIRDRFTREKRLKPSGSEGGESNWVYYEKMGFYHRCTRPRKTHTSLQATTSKATNVGKAYTPCSTSPSSSGWSGIETILSPQSESESVEEGQETGETVVPQTTPQTKKESCTSKKGDIESVVESCKKIVAAIENKRTAVPDQNRTFVEYVYSRLAEMSPDEARETRRSIIKILENL